MVGRLMGHCMMPSYSLLDDDDDFVIAVFAGGRKYAMRADTKFELDMWLEVCNRHGRMWLTDLSV